MAKNKLKFTSCLVPKIESIEPYDVTFDSKITINGTGFSSEKCENEVYIGDKLCSIISVTKTQIKCQIGKASGLESYKNHSVEVKVKNIGYALKLDNYIFVRFLAAAIDVTPKQGSSNGGSLVTVIGDGFDQSTTVKLGNIIYDSSNSLISYDSIKFITLENTGKHNLTVFDCTNRREVEYKDELNYEFSSAYNPQITSINPNVIDKETNISIVGNNFGTDLSEIDLKIGDQICQVVDLTPTSISCTIQGLEEGLHSVHLNVKSIGNANIFDEKITGKLSVRSITPDSGSIFGGTNVKIRGNGFTSESIVNIGLSSCFIKNVRINEIECQTNANSQDRLHVKVNNLNTGTVSTDLVDYTFDSDKTPSINTIAPDEENFKSSVLTLTGENFSTDKNEVHIFIGGSECKVIHTSMTQIECILGEQGAGTYQIDLRIDPFGFANHSFEFTYNLNIHGLSSNNGSLAGGLHLEISGSGFSDQSRVIICEKECKLLNYSSSLIFCIVPPSDSPTDQFCTLEIQQNGKSVNEEFSYKESLTPTLLSSSPKRGGTGGGTILTLIGKKFM